MASDLDIKNKENQTGSAPKLDGADLSLTQNRTQADLTAIQDRAEEARLQHSFKAAAEDEARIANLENSEKRARDDAHRAQEEKETLDREQDRKERKTARAFDDMELFLEITEIQQQISELVEKMGEISGAMLLKIEKILSDYAGEEITLTPEEEKIVLEILKQSSESGGQSLVTYNNIPEGIDPERMQRLLFLTEKMLHEDGGDEYIKATQKLRSLNGDIRELRGIAEEVEEKTPLKQQTQEEIDQLNFERDFPEEARKLEMLQLAKDFAAHIRANPITIAEIKSELAMLGIEAENDIELVVNEMELSGATIKTFEPLENSRHSAYANNKPEPEPQPRYEDEAPRINIAPASPLDS